MTQNFRRAVGALCLLVIGTAFVQSLAPAAAQTGPRITLDRPEVGPGEAVLVTFEGFDSQFVNFVVCGNLAYRGATDCNVTAGVSKETNPGGAPKVVQLIAHAPPVHCPCIVRATASSGDDFAVAPIVIIGHPVADLVGVPQGPLVDVEVEAREANEGFWSTVRSALGGPTRYEATVSVRNRSTETLTRLNLTGSVGHWLDDDAAVLDLEAPAALEPGHTWTRDLVAEVSAPSVGTYSFEVIAAGAGSSVTETVSTSHQPILLWLCAFILVVDIVVAVSRWISKRRARRDELLEDEYDDDYDDDYDELDDDEDLVDLRLPPSSPVPV